ncbi:hypothetical protein NFI96_033768 [Prochilodus magdalenae]|nr:hypothetical protein NFI96_033768 [Prochilodus magdalenae]
MYGLSAETHNVITRVVHYVGSKERLETEPCPNMASAVPVVEDGEDFSFLPLIHDIIKCMDKENQDVHQELNRLRVRIQEAREQILAMPGIEASPEAQQQRLCTLRDQVRIKNQLLHKYKGLCMFDIPKPS